MLKNRTNLKWDFYICFNDLCSYFGTHQSRATGIDSMKPDTIPEGYYQGNPVCRWCSTDMEVAHTDNTANEPHIEWDGILPDGERYYQLRFYTLET